MTNGYCEICSSQNGKKKKGRLVIYSDGNLRRSLPDNHLRRRGKRAK
jgi:hypothetical protein